MAHKEEKSRYIVGLFDDDEKLLHACEVMMKKKLAIKDVFTPFPVHGLDEVLEYRPSRLPDVAFIFGLLGMITALTMMTVMYTFDWPMNVGGKPGFPLPNFIPITFELTVLFASLGMVFTYWFVNKLSPAQRPEIVEPRQTDDLFVIVAEPDGSPDGDRGIHDLMKKEGAIETREQLLTAKWYNI